MVTFSNNVEPANGFLVRYLHRKLIETEDESTVHSSEMLRVLDWVPKLWYHLHTFLEKHSTSDFLIGTALHVLNVCFTQCSSEKKNKKKKHLTIYISKLIRTTFQRLGYNLQ